MKRFYLLAFLIACSLFISCDTKEITRFYLDDEVYWAEANAGTNLYNYENLNFQNMDDFKASNLERLVGREGAYVWLKIKFRLPEALRNQPLGLVIPYLHYADKTYLNNQFVGSYGGFPPEEYSAQYVSHFYLLPYEKLNQRGENTLIVQVWVHGKGTLSGGICIDKYENAKVLADILDFFRSKIYIFFESGLLISFILFSILGGKKSSNGQAMRIFAAIHIPSMLFLFYFFAPEIPLYQYINDTNCLGVKFFFCTMFYCITFHIPTFLMAFLEYKEKKWFLIIRMTFFLLCLILTFAAPDYNTLMKICPITLTISILQNVIGVYAIIWAYRIPERKLRSIAIIKSVVPLTTAIFLDFIIRGILRNVTMPYFSIFGWMISTVVLIHYFGKQYKQTAQQNFYLTRHLREEVDLKTVDLTFANERLEREITNSTKDMEMASIVQKKFYPQTEDFFDGWEISVCFEPMAQVSGDLYDYYAEEHNLHGIGLFDASGHGVAASLITMLAKSIIFRQFRHSRVEKDSLAVTLEKINEKLIKEKGEVTNYLTGVLVRIGEFDNDNRCLFEMASAGHPYPVYYSSETNEMITVTHDEYQEQYGALGIKDVDVSFPNVDLNISLNDVLVFFTDGVTEAQNEDSDEFGVARIEQIVLENHAKNAHEIMEAIKKGVFEFIEGVPRTDDISFMVIKRVPRWEK